MELSQLVKQMKPTAVPRVMAYASQYEDVLYFTMGEPDFPSPEIVKKEAIDQIQKDYTKYTDEQGELSLREKIALKYNQLYKTDLNENNVLISSGGTGASYLTMLATLNQEDEVLLLSPYYSNLIGQVESLGAKVSIVYLNPDDYFKINIEDIEKKITEKTKMLIINSPNNPMGKILEEGEVEKISELAFQHNLYILSDEIYRTTVFSGEHHSFIHPNLINYKNTFIIDSFSKSLSMTGYRVGFVVSPNEEAIKAMTEFNDWIYGSVAGFTQKAAEKGLLVEEEYSTMMKKSYAERSSYLSDRINALPKVSVKPSQATFYLWMDIRQTGMTSEEYVFRLIDEERVALIPGNNYGPSGEGFVRIACTKEKRALEELVVRMKRFHDKL